MSPDDRRESAASGRVFLSIFFLLHLGLAGAAGWLTWVVVPLIKQAVKGDFGEIPMPEITQFFFDHEQHAVLFSLPWLAYAAFALFRGRAAFHHLVLYSSSLILSVVVLAIAAAIGLMLPWFPVARNVPRLVFGSHERMDTLLGATEISVQRLHRIKDFQGSRKGLAGYERGAFRTLDPLQTARVQQILTDRSSYNWRIRNLCAPTYEILLTARTQEKEVHFALCFHCGKFGVFDSADNDEKANTENQLGGAGSRMLVHMVKQLFPDDPEIQKIK
jgi:hypothetical protein